jgi:citrate/tricarballylate utilization protein
MPAGSSLERPAPLSGAGGRTPLPLLVAEATRQLDICNACRYCEGLCAVFPALERRNVLDAGDVSQLANLCHDCRACLDACMYAPPHEFGVNLPRALSELRLADYRRYTWPRRTPRWLRGWAGMAIGIPVVTAVLALIALAINGQDRLVATPRGPASPYALLPYPVLLVLTGVPAVFALAVMAAAARRYWTETGSTPTGLGAAAFWRAALDALTLRYLRGGGGGCYYPADDTPSPGRRRWHTMVAGGFALCVLSTVSAAVLQDFLGSRPPYPPLSVPVVAGTVGGIAIAFGCAGLLMIKPAASRSAASTPMVTKDYALLTALTFLAVSGLATLFTRTTAAYGLVLLVHLVAVAFTFIAAPYGKFPHFIYRFLALLRDNAEKRV